MEYTTLHNGAKMPMLGYGTIGQEGGQIIENVAFALHNGYGLIDTANRYGNEVEVGRGLKKSGLAREEYFLETKLGPTLYSKDGAVEDTLKRLDTDYVDLMLLHHPVNDYLHAYKMLEKAYREGKLRAIGVSNFPVEKLREVLEQCEIRPMVMQVECHPYYPAEQVRAFCEEQGIRLQCWYPLGLGSTDLVNNPVLVGLAQMYGKSAAQIVLRWHLQMGFCPVPGSSSKEHIRENGQIFDFALTAGDMERIAGINRHAPIYQVTSESLQRLATTKCNFEA